jgi:hypothetical protein
MSDDVSDVWMGDFWRYGGTAIWLLCAVLRLIREMREG